MVSKTEQRSMAREEKLYEHLISIADPVSGKVAISGPQAGEAIGCGAPAARLFLGKLVKDGKLVQISDTKTGTPTLYRIPAFSKGDVRTTYMEPKQIVEPEPMKMTIPNPPMIKHQFPATQGASAQDIAKAALKEQEDLMSKILIGYMNMYRALEEIAEERA